MAAFETYRATGTLRMNDSGLQVHLTLLWARGGRMRFEIEAPLARGLVLVADGERIWRLIVDVSPQLLELGCVPLERARRQTGFGAADFERRGDRLSYAGREELKGRPVDRVDVRFADGEAGLATTRS